MSVEHCSICDEPTGRAGRADDSIYIDLPDGATEGPLCPECYGDFSQMLVEKWESDHAAFVKQQDNLRTRLEEAELQVATAREDTLCDLRTWCSRYVVEPRGDRLIGLKYIGVVITEIERRLSTQPAPQSENPKPQPTCGGSGVMLYGDIDRHAGTRPPQTQYLGGENDHRHTDIYACPGCPDCQPQAPGQKGE